MFHHFFDGQFAAGRDGNPFGRGGRGHSHGPHGGNPFGGNPFPRLARMFLQGRRARRGDVRTAILVLLGEQPRNGYQLMQEMEARSGGTWRPSPGSVYPTLEQLSDEGLIRAEGTEGGRTFQLTEKGRKHLANRKEGAAPPWETPREPGFEEVSDLGVLIREIAGASMQAVNAGRTQEAIAVLQKTRKALYQMLAEDQATDEDEAED
jgi:DNA-binding PadR family transcriptional regulator